MKNAKMRTRLIVGFFIPIVLTVINSLLGMYGTRSAIDSVRSQYELEEAQVRDTLDEIGADGEKGAYLLNEIAAVKETSLEQMDVIVLRSNIFSLVMIVLSIMITLMIAFSIIKAIVRSVNQLSDASKW